MHLYRCMSMQVSWTCTCFFPPSISTQGSLLEALRRHPYWTLADLDHHCTGFFWVRHCWIQCSGALSWNPPCRQSLFFIHSMMHRIYLHIQSAVSQEWGNSGLCWTKCHPSPHCHPQTPSRSWGACRPEETLRCPAGARCTAWGPLFCKPRNRPDSLATWCHPPQDSWSKNMSDHIPWQGLPS